VYDLSYECWGDTTDADDVVNRGDLSSAAFSTWWLRAGVIVAAFVMNRPDDERTAAPLWIAERRRVDATRLRDADAL
jgi:hypothetical protein